MCAVFTKKEKRKEKKIEHERRQFTFMNCVLTLFAEENQTCVKHWLLHASNMFQALFYMINSLYSHYPLILRPRAVAKTQRSPKASENLL